MRGNEGESYDICSLLGRRAVDVSDIEWNGDTGRVRREYPFGVSEGSEFLLQGLDVPEQDSVPLGRGRFNSGSPSVSKSLPSSNNCQRASRAQRCGFELGRVTGRGWW